MADTFIISEGKRYKVKDHSGIGYYTEGLAVFKVFFPEGNVGCRHCEHCHYKNEYGTYKCYLTKEYLNKSDLDQCGKQCPIIFEEEI